MNSRAAGWRRPAVAPLWAAAVAFGAVGLASLVAQVTPTVTVIGDELPADLVVQIQGTDIVLSKITGWSAAVPAGEHTLCPASAEPVRVAGTTPTSCVTAAGPTTQIRVEHVAVRVTSADGGRVATGRTIRVAAGAGSPAERGAIDPEGRWLPRHSLVGREVCLDPPLGWVVTGAPATTGRACVVPTDGLSDVTFELEASR